MEQYTLLNKEEIATVLAQFNIYNISSFKLLSGGSENTNYLIESENRKVVICICEQKTLAETKGLAELIKHLEKNGFTTSKIISSSNHEPVILWKGKPILIKEYIEGKIQKNLSPRLLNLIGKEIGKLNKIDAPDYLPNQLNFGKEQFSNVKKYAAHSEFDIWLNKVLEYMSPYFKMDLPKSLIHADVFWDNVIVSENESSAVIMDFEEAAYYYRVFDIGMAIIGICGEENIINLEKVKYLLAGYQSEIKLLDDEIKSLKAFTIYAGAAMAYWRHQNFNYVKPDPKKFDHYLGLKVLADFMIGQPDDCFSK